MLNVKGPTANSYMVVDVPMSMLRGDRAGGARRTPVSSSAPLALT